MIIASNCLSGGKWWFNPPGHNAALSAAFAVKVSSSLSIDGGTQSKSLCAPFFYLVT